MGNHSWLAASSWLELTLKNKEPKQNPALTVVLGRESCGSEISADIVMSINSLQKHTANGEPPKLVCV